MSSDSSSKRRSKKHGEDHEAENGERWLLTYADMITLLLVLFIVLFAISSINQAKFREFKQSVTKAVDSRTPQGSTNAMTNSKGSPPGELHKIEQQLVKALEAKKLLRQVSITTTTQGLVVGLLSDSTLFVSNSAQLTAEGLAIVDSSAQVMRKFPNAIEVAGYTDDQPIQGGPYADNWALSAARATTVVERMAGADGVDPTHLAIVGLGQYHPTATNATPAGRAQNRRVNIIVSKSSTSAF